MRYIFLLVLSINFLIVTSQETTVKLGLLKYSGGGDWYANPTSLPNLIDFCNRELNTTINKDYQEIEVGSPDIFNFPSIYTSKNPTESRVIMNECNPGFSNLLSANFPISSFPV